MYFGIQCEAGISFYLSPDGQSVVSAPCTKQFRFFYLIVMLLMSNIKFAICTGLFFLFIWKGALYILDTNPLPLIHVANVSSHFEILINRSFYF